MSKQKKLDFDEELKKYLAYTQEQFQSPDMDSPNLRIEGDRIVDDEGADYTDWAKENFYEKDPNKMLSFPQGIRKAAWDAKSRQAQHLEDALTKGYELADTLDRQFNPESYAQRRSGRGAISMPVGGRAGMANLYRPQYEADMNEAFVAPRMVMNDKQQMVKSNDDYAERNKAKGYLGINKRDDGSVYYTGSEQVRQNLENEIAEIKKKIKLEETLQQLDIANDPAWGAAKISFIYNGDRSGIDAIANRIEAKIGREFTAAENEKNRKSNIDIAKANKEAEDQAKADDAMENYEWQKEAYNYLVDKYNKDGATMDSKSRAELENKIAEAKIKLKYKARKAKMEDEYNELLKAAEGSDEDRVLNDSINKFFALNGVTADTFKGVYDAASKDQQKKYRDMMAIMQIPEEKLLGEAASVKAENTNEANTAAARKKADFKKNNSSKSFELNPLTGKPMNAQAWEDFKKEAKAAGWSSIELQNNGAILWK